jgi:hypothetical protein
MSPSRGNLHILILGIFFHGAFDNFQIGMSYSQLNALLVVSQLRLVIAGWKLSATTIIASASTVL